MDETEHLSEDYPFITREHAINCARNVARHQGYAIAVHGSLVKDVDLVAIPWIEPCAITPLMLAEIIADALPGFIEVGPEIGPHGKTGFVIRPFVHFGFDNWYIDLSVVPRRRKQKGKK